MTNAIYPFATKVSQVAKRCVRSFHALPLSGGASLRGSVYLEHYTDILCDYFSAELSISAPFLDCLISPESELAAAEMQAAADIGADETLFCTCGTTISNEIAARALLQMKKPRVLADRMLHQSLHFALRTLGARIDYIPTRTLSDEFQINCPDLNACGALIAQAEEDNAPYDAVFVNGQTYEGVGNDISKFVEVIAVNSPRTRQLFVDEAWGAASGYHPRLRKFTAMAAAATPTARENGFTIVATQSAHKSLSALRQASMIHVRGSKNIASALKDWRYRCHTTSPSSTILASLDLACAQARDEGHAMIQRSLSLAEKLRKAVATDKGLYGFEIAELTSDTTNLPHVYYDPTKVLLVSRIPGLGGKTLRKRLFDEFGLYVSRTIKGAILVNFHIGIQQVDLDLLLDALRQIAAECTQRIETEGSISAGFIISYPPGIPLALPGDVISKNVLSQMQAAKADGSRIISVA